MEQSKDNTIDGVLLESRGNVMFPFYSSDGAGPDRHLMQAFTEKDGVITEHRFYGNTPEGTRVIEACNSLPRVKRDTWKSTVLKLHFDPAFPPRPQPAGLEPPRCFNCGGVGHFPKCEVGIRVAVELELSKRVSVAVAAERERCAKIAETVEHITDNADSLAAVQFAQRLIAGKIRSAE